MQISNPGEKNELFVIDYDFSRTGDNNEILYGHCLCTADNLAKCKHAVAVLMFLTK